MKNVKWYTLSLIICLTVFFNIERLDFERQDLINIDSYVYFLGFLTVVAVMALPVLWRTHVLISVLGCMAIYVSSKIFLFDNHPLLGGLYTYISLLEVMFLGILTWLSQALARVLHDFEKAVENITLSDFNQRVQPLEEVRENIKTYMLLSRRQQHPLSVVIVKPKPESISAALNNVVRNVQKTMMVRYVITGLGHTLSSILRRTDLMMVQREENRFIILCPETDVQGLDVFIDRVQTAAEQLGISVSCGKASFPDEALTFEELVDKAESKIGNTLQTHAYTSANHDKRHSGLTIKTQRNS